MPQKPADKVVVSLSCVDPRIGQKFEAVVPLPDGATIDKAYDARTVGRVVTVAGQEFRQHIATVTGGAVVDALEFIIESIGVAPEIGQTSFRYWVSGTYNNLTEPGTWSDHVDGISSVDVELRARFMIACDETGLGRDELPTVKKFFDCVASYMERVIVEDVTPDPLSKEEIVGIVSKIMNAGRQLIATLENCASPEQQAAANGLAGLHREGEQALEVMTKAEA